VLSGCGLRTTSFSLARRPISRTRSDALSALPVDLSSYRAHDGVETERRAEPHRLVATDRRWYVVAFDLDRDDWRTFRVDRASSVVLTGHTFVPRDLDDPAGMVAEGIATATSSYLAVVRILAPRDEVARRVPLTVAVLEDRGEETVAEIGADDFDWLAGYMTALGWEFEVLEPVEWRSLMADLGQRLLEAHRQIGR
jgi:predicted DNA-binding transcriptional regulator YafY